MLDAKKIVNGTFCKVYHEGRWLFNVTSAEVSVTIGVEDVNRSGTRWIGKKVTTLSGEGSFTGYKISNEFLALISQVTDDVSSPYATELVLEVNDPESPESKTFITLQDVQFSSIPLLSFEAGSLVEEEHQFTFSGYSTK